MIPYRECTAHDFVLHGSKVASLAQLGIAHRSAEYGNGAWGWSVLGHDPRLAGSYARTAVTLAKLAFPDLHQESEQKEVAA